MAVTIRTDHAQAGDVEVLEAIAAGDRSAFVELFGRYAGRIKGFLMRAGASEADAEEVVQEVMVAIWRRAATFDPERAAPATWIFTIARNRRIDLIRKSRRPEPDPLDPLFQPDPEPQGVERISAAEHGKRVRDGLATLAPE
jgi:RNA polymerase sigma-70 factor (ECF subfamily)